MAFFRKKAQTRETPVGRAIRSRTPALPLTDSARALSSVAETHSRRSIADVLVRPRVTEKGTIVSAHRAYTFNVAPWANKHEIAAAVHAVYNIAPTKVTVARIPAKNRFVRGKWGTKVGGKKAYVFLKKGDKIEFV